MGDKEDRLVDEGKDLSKREKNLLRKQKQRDDPAKKEQEKLARQARKNPNQAEKERVAKQEARKDPQVRIDEASTRKQNRDKARAAATVKDAGNRQGVSVDMIETPTREHVTPRMRTNREAWEGGI